MCAILKLLQYNEVKRTVYRLTSGCGSKRKLIQKCVALFAAIDGCSCTAGRSQYDPGVGVLQTGAH